MPPIPPDQRSPYDCAGAPVEPHLPNAPKDHQDRGIAGLNTPTEPPEKRAFTIRQFCVNHGISPATYFKLRALGLGPREMRLGGNVVRISIEAAQAWRRARENPANAEATATNKEAEALRQRAIKAATKSIASPRHVRFKSKT